MKTVKIRAVQKVVFEVTVEVTEAEYKKLMKFPDELDSRDERYSDLEGYFNPVDYQPLCDEYEDIEIAKVG
jgi:hypothetical protein